MNKDEVSCLSFVFDKKKVVEDLVRLNGCVELINKGKEQADRSDI